MRAGHGRRGSSYWLVLRPEDQPKIHAHGDTPRAHLCCMWLPVFRSSLRGMNAKDRRCYVDDNERGQAFVVAAPLPAYKQSPLFPAEPLRVGREAEAAGTGERGGELERVRPLPTAEAESAQIVQPDAQDKAIEALV